MYRVVLCGALYTCAASIIYNTYSLENAETLFEKFIIEHNRQYADQDKKQMRFEIFKQTLVRINKLNEREEGRQVHGINKFSDYTEEETKRLRGFRPSNNGFCNIVKTDDDIPDAQAPDAFDWRDRNVVSPVQNQLPTCGSCYAFSSAGTIEGQFAMKTSKLVPLSKQQIVDCFQGQRVNSGCIGGVPSGTLMNIVDSGGIETESDYPYRGDDKSPCLFNASKVAVKITGCTSYKLKSQNKLKQVVYKTGPLSVALDGSRLLDYTNKVLKNCEGIPDHAVLLVGYGTDPSDGDYWLLKNSWGADWGEDGYFRIERGERKTSCALMYTEMVLATL